MEDTERRLREQRDRASRTLDAQTNEHSYEAHYLMFHQQMHSIPLEHRVCIGNCLEIACLQAWAALGDAQAAAALHAAVRLEDIEA